MKSSKLTAALGIGCTAALVLVTAGTGGRAGRRSTGGLAPNVADAPVLMVTTQGGHLAQLLALRAWWSDHETIWVAPHTPDVEDRLGDQHVVTSYSPTTRSARNLARNTVLAVRTMRHHRPALVVSAGAGVAVPFFVVAWIMRVPTVFIEVYDRVDSATMTGRLCGPFTTRQIVQWPSQLESYPNAMMTGPLL